MRRALDNLYEVSLWLSALCLAIIASMVGAQLAGRLLDGTLALLHLPRTDFVILSLAEISGYLLAAASFLALAPTLKAGAHIRVTMVLGAIGPRLRHLVEIGAFVLACIGAVYMTWHLANFAYVSWQFDEVSPGVVRVPLWIPQAAMAFGATVFSIALIDELIVVMRGHGPSFRASEDSISLGKEG